MAFVPLIGGRQPRDGKDTTGRISDLRYIPEMLRSWKIKPAASISVMDWAAFPAAKKDCDKSLQNGVISHVSGAAHTQHRLPLDILMLLKIQFNSIVRTTVI